MVLVLVAVGQRKKFANGLPQLTKENKKSQKGSQMLEYNVDCEECENSTIVLTYEEPSFCPCCGRRAEVEQRLDETDWGE